MKMQKRYALSFLLAIAGIATGALQAQNQKTASYRVHQVSMVQWNTADGLPYKEVPGVNLGSTSFERMDREQIAFLSNASDELIITDKTTGKVTRKFPVTYAPQDFVYDKGLFYVLSEKQVSVYDEQGAFLNKYILPASALGVERITRFRNETWLLLPSGNSLKIESAGQAMTAAENEGWITQAGHFVSAKIGKDNSYSVHVTTNAGKSFDKTFPCDKPVAGVYVVGATEGRIVLDVQTFVSESPIKVERTIVSIELNANGLEHYVTSIQVPDCYYVLSNTDLRLSAKGSVQQMVTTPKGAYIFSLSEVRWENDSKYPEAVSGIKYHFNDHLKSVEEK